MGSMDYCLFENTLNELRRCIDKWNDELSDTEKIARDKIMKLAQMIVVENSAD